MATLEEEYRKREPVVKWLSTLALLGKKIAVKGQENFLRKGPNILVGNHIGSYKDIATLIKIVPRPIFFTANKMIFSKNEFNHLIRKHAQRHLKNFGLFLDLVLSPLKSLFVNYISSNIGEVGTVPVDFYGGKTLAVELCQNHLRAGRTVVAFQGRGRLGKKEQNPYVSQFRRGASIMCYNLYQEGIPVPVTPMAMFGTHFPFLIPTNIKVNVGEPMYISDYWSSEFFETVEEFRCALERRVRTLLFELLTKSKSR